MNDDLITAKEAGDRLGFCAEYVRRLMRSGAIASEKLGRSVRTRQSYLDEYARKKNSAGDRRLLLVRWLALVPDADVRALRALAAETFGFPDPEIDAALGAWAKNRPVTRHNASVEER